VLIREPQLRRLGARYAAAGSPAAHADPDRAAWAALDEGHDPTADPPPDRPTGRLVDQATAAGGDGSAESDDPGGGRGGAPV
jgi:hypothetical protein